MKLRAPHMSCRNAEGVKRSAASPTPQGAATWQGDKEGHAPHTCSCLPMQWAGDMPPAACGRLWSPPWREAIKAGTLPPSTWRISRSEIEARDLPPSVAGAA